MQSSRTRAICHAKYHTRLTWRCCFHREINLILNENRRVIKFYCHTQWLCKIVYDLVVLTDHTWCYSSFVDRSNNSSARLWYYMTFNFTTRCLCWRWRSRIMCWSIGWMVHILLLSSESCTIHISILTILHFPSICKNWWPTINACWLHHIFPG